MRWFRLYSDLLHDPKAQRLTPALFKHWINLLCLANEGTPRGTLPDEDDIAFALRIKPSDARKIMHQLAEAGLMERSEQGRWAPHNWSERQRASDDVAERVRRHRSKESPHDPRGGAALGPSVDRAVTAGSSDDGEGATQKPASIPVSEAIRNGDVTLHVTLPKRTVDTDTESDTEKKRTRRKIESSLSAATADAAPQPRPINPLWDELVTQFYEPKGQLERGRFGKAVNHLKKLNATVEDVRLRCENHRTGEYHWTLTPLALVAHWGELEQRSRPLKATGTADAIPHTGNPFGMPDLSVDWDAVRSGARSGARNGARNGSSSNGSSGGK